MYGYNAARTAPVEHAYPGGHGHGGGQHHEQHQQQHQYQQQHQQHFGTQRGEHQQSYGNGEVDYYSHTSGGYGSPQGPVTSAPSLYSYNQPDLSSYDHAQEQRQQLQQSHRHNGQEGPDSAYHTATSLSSSRPSVVQGGRQPSVQHQYSAHMEYVAPQYTSNLDLEHQHQSSWVAHEYPVPSDTPRQSNDRNRRLPSKSPTLPALSGTSHTPGLGSLSQQLEAEIDQIQAKHTPVSSPASANFASLSSQAVAWSSSSEPAYLRSIPERYDSGNTLKGYPPIEPAENSYGGSGIISMYDPRVPSPIPDSRGSMLRQPSYSDQSSSYFGFPSASTYGLRQAQGGNTGAQAAFSPVANPADSHRRPSWPTNERQRHQPASDTGLYSGASATPEHPAIARTPRSSAGESQIPVSIAGRARPSNSSLRSSRPSHDSNLSLSSASQAQFSSSSATGIIAPRPSLSSSLASRPSINASESSQSRVRPLPIPNASPQESELLSQSSVYVASPDIYESLPAIRERTRSEFSRQSDFAKDFYAAGNSLPTSMQQRANTLNRPSPSGRHPVADRYRSNPHQAERNHVTGGRKQTDIPATISATNPSTSSFCSPSETSTQAAPLLPLQTFPSHPPPIVHSQSDPLANHRSPSTSSSRTRQNSNQPQAMAAGGSRTPRSSASRSASFSASAARDRSDYSRRNVPMGHNVNIRQTQGRHVAMAEHSPPLPSSPSISISTSFHDTSINSAYSTLSTAPSNSTYTSAMQKQASVSPSNLSLSAQGFLSSRQRRNSERERRRIEGLGLQHLNPALLSNLAVAFKDRIPRSLNVKGSVHYPSSFTGEQAVSCLAEMLPFPYTDDRRIAVVIARNLHRNMFFNEVDWEDAKQLRDSCEHVYCFQDDEEQATIDYLSGNAAAEGVYSPTARPKDHLASQMHEVPNGVITRFTKCYSPFCGMEGTASSGSCYSLYCPNGKHPLGLQRKQSSLSLAASTSTEEPSAPEAWASTVPPELLERLGPKEVARQNVIFEIITGEQAYKKDLDMLEMAYAEPLRSANPPIIEPNRLLSFTNQVFNNLDELRSHSGRLVNAFQIRQREQNPVVDYIGDLILDAALEWGQAYMDFAEAQVIGEYFVQEEKSTNSAFATFLQSRREAFGIKQDFRHYHLRPTIRLQRYLLPLAEYVKRCPEGHSDRETVQEAMRIIRQQCDACNAAVAAAQLRLACTQYDKLIERDFNYANDLDLLHPSRQLFHHGKMYAKPEGARSEWTEYQVMLFDHYLAIAKPRRTAEGYRLIRKPVRLEMLHVGGWDDPPIIRSSGFHLSNVIRTGDRREASSSYNTGDRTESKMWPIAFRIYGRLSGTLTLFVETPKNDKDGQARREWKAKVEQAAAVRKAVMDAGQVFELSLLMDPDLRKPTSAANPPASSMGKILASCPFTGPTGQRLVAVGTSTGLFIALKCDPTSLRQILQISVQYCAVLQDFGMFLVHTEGRLLSYLLETLVQTSSGEGKGQQGPQQVSGQKDILFFKVGRVGPRTLVVYAKKDGVSSTVLKAMEPVANAERSRVQHSRFLGMGGKKTEWFRLFKDAAVPTEVYNLTFTRSKLALVCAPGFEILDIDTLKTGSFPDWTSIKTDPTKFDASMAMLQRRCYESRAIGLFRISDSEFLFCYEDFAFLADRHGDPVRARFKDMIEWEGRPDTVVYCAPYILAFESRFIEIRDVSNQGKLVQIIRGTNIRCTYDGQGLPSADMEIRMGGTVKTEERLPHFVIRENNVDRLYELAPRPG